MGFSAIERLDFPCLTSMPLESRVQLYFFLTKGLCYSLVEDGSRVSLEWRASVKQSKNKKSSSNIMILNLRVR